MKEQNQTLTHEQREYKEDTDKKAYDLDRVLKDTQKARIDIEADLRRIENELDKSLTDHYDHKMFQEGDKKSEEELKLRHDLEVKLLGDLLAKKKIELDKVNADVAKIADDFLKWKDLQDNIAEQNKLRDDTEAAKVKIQFLNIQVKLLEDAVQTLNDKRDELTGEQMEAQSKNEELKNQLKVQEETAAKRLQLKLNRDKSAEVKDLIANEEMIKAHNDEISTKLRQQKEDYDKLLSGKMEAEEVLKLKKEQLEEDTTTVAEQDAKLAELKKQIEDEQGVVDDLTNKIEEGTKVKKTEEERHRHLQQQNTALGAKKEFIEAEYDYTTHAEGMNLEVFRDIMRSNNTINETVAGFVTKVDVVKQEVQKINAAKYTF